MVRDRSIVSTAFDVLNYLVLTTLALACALPVVHVLAVSLSDRASVTAGLVTFLPRNLHFENYRHILLRDSLVLITMRNSLVRVVLGVVSQVVLTLLTAYPLAVRKAYRGQSFFKALLIVGMLFYGGLIPWFLVLHALHLVDNIWGLVLPSALSVWSVILMVNFFRDVPIELAEAAEIDGASHWQVLFRIYAPLSLPAVALVTLYAIVGHWNSWFDGLILMSTPEKYPLQTLLQTRIVGNYRSLPPTELTALISDRAQKAAQIIIAFIPVAIVYPFLQRYFVTGLKLGAIKG